MHTWEWNSGTLRVLWAEFRLSLPSAQWATCPYSFPGTSCPAPLSWRAHPNTGRKSWAHTVLRWPGGRREGTWQEGTADLILSESHLPGAGPGGEEEGEAQVGTWPGSNGPSVALLSEEAEGLRGLSLFPSFHPHPRPQERQPTPRPAEFSTT